MSYILDLMKGTVDPHPDRISLERYVQESSYITRFVSRVVKDKALVVYHVLFHLSWFETGKGEIIVPWPRVGSFIVNERGNVMDGHNTTSLKARLPDLFKHKCIAINRPRSGANEISVHLPSDIPTCRQLIQQDERNALIEIEQKDERDYYNDPQRRLMILARDSNGCVYCTAALSEDSFFLDHLVPVAKGGTNRKHNLVAACEICNRRRSDSEPIQFLRENYRQQLLTQDEFLRQKDYIERLLGEGAAKSDATNVA
jgi:5-methylcytosine-specific restriction endonuclease McrA